MRHKDRLSDEEAKARRLESARKYREANREKTREASRLSQAKRRENPAVKEREKIYKQDPGYLERQRQYRAENKDRLIAGTKAWQEANPEKYMQYQRSYQSANRHRAIERKKQWRAKNSDWEKAYGRKWRQANLPRLVINAQRRRARIKGVGGDLSHDIHVRLMKIQKGKCAVCHTDLKKSGHHLDHHMPLALGGSNTDSNMQLLCPPCNLSKGPKHPVDFMRARGFLL